MKKSNSIPLIFMIGVFAWACTPHKEVIETETPVSVKVSIPSQVIDDKISVSGQLESRNSAIISTRMMGFISTIHANPGDKVEKGQLLVTISNDDIQAKRAQADAMILEAEAALLDAEKDFSRFEKLYKQGSASEKEYENALLRFNAVKAKAEGAHQVKRETDAMLEYANLTAPFSGVITQKHVNEGSMANPGMPILTIEQPSGFQVRALVSESEVGLLRNEMDAEVIVKSTGRTFHAKILEISPSSQFTGGRFQVKLRVPASENTGLFSGMYVNVNIAVANHSGMKRLFVPAFAIVHRDQLTGLYTIDQEHKAQLRWIKVGRTEAGQVEVLGGLRADEEFITQRENRLYSGAPVFINNDITGIQ